MICKMIYAICNIQSWLHIANMKEERGVVWWVMIGWGGYELTPSQPASLAPLSRPKICIYSTHLEKFDATLRQAKWYDKMRGITFSWSWTITMFSYDDQLQVDGDNSSSCRLKSLIYGIPGWLKWNVICDQNDHDADDSCTGCFFHWASPKKLKLENLG